MNRILAVLLSIYVIFIFNGCLPQQPLQKPSDIVAQGVALEGISIAGLDKHTLEQKVSILAKDKYTAPKDALFDHDTGIIIHDKKGYTVNVNETVNLVMQAAPNSNVSLIYQEVGATITKERLSSAKLLGRFSTPILDNSAGRLNNIRLTAKIVNNTVVAPNSEFSFNKATGEPTIERGFSYAPIFVEGGRHEKGLGGGMCQVSSTLYNAVLAANLTVTERHPHSQPVAYVPLGRDATTFTDKDFRFVNNTRYPIIIRAFIQDGRIVADIWELAKD